MSQPNRQVVSVEELALSNMLTVNALVELLSEKGLVSQQEVLERVKRLRTEMTERRRHQ